jgi:hypothetical protein
VEIVQGGVLGLAGPDKRIAGLLTCTIIRPGDAADQLTDRDKHPEWQGERSKLVYEWPTNEKLWDEYARLYLEGLRNGDRGRAATEMYRKNRLPMDQGARVGWQERYPDDCISAIQHAFNLRLRDEDAFASEYQNEPLSHEEENEFLDADAICAKINGRAVGTIPTSCNHLALYEDVHDKLLYWVLVAWQDDFTGFVVDYGTYPDQERAYFTMRQATKTLGRVAQGAGREGAIYAGLKALNDKMLTKQWRRDDGAMMRVNMALVDERYETATIYKFINEYPCGYIYPAMGLALSATSQPFHSRPNKPGERTGDHCRLTQIVGKAKGRHLVIDTNHWKTFTHRRLATAAGDAGCLSIYGRRRADGEPASITQHRLLAEHLTAETHHVVVGPYGPADVWNNESGRDNHWFDCLVGCTVIASLLGCTSGPRIVAPKRTPQPVRRRKAGKLKC